MTPEEKAKDIFDSYWYCLMQSDIRDRHYWSKECALIVVDEIIKERYFHNEYFKQNSKLKYHIEIELAERLEATRNYWLEVKHEIEKL